MTIENGLALINELIVSKAYRNQKIGEDNFCNMGLTPLRERGMDEIKSGRHERQQWSDQIL